MYDEEAIKEETPLEEAVGFVTYKQAKTSSNGKQFVSIKVDNQFYTIWDNKFFGVNRGDRVSLWFSRKYSPRGDFCIVKQLTVVQPAAPQGMPQAAHQPPQTTQSPFGQPMHTTTYVQPPQQPQQQFVPPMNSSNPGPSTFQPKQTVQRPFQKAFKDDSDRFDLGMAINGAVTLIGETAHDFNDAIQKIQTTEYDQLVELLFTKNKALRAKYC